MTTRLPRWFFLSAGFLLTALGLCGCNSLAIMGPGSFSTVVIDAGHGGKDNGGRSRSGIQEKDVALDTAKRLRSLLQNAGLRTVMIRTDDTFVELDDRVNIANRYLQCGFGEHSLQRFAQVRWPTGASRPFSGEREQLRVGFTRVERHLVESKPRSITARRDPAGAPADS